MAVDDLKGNGYWKIGLLVAVLGLILPGASSAQAPGQLTLDIVFGDRASTTLPSQLVWTTDGGRLSYLWSDDDGSALWLLDPARRQTDLVVRMKELESQAGGTFTLDRYQWFPGDEKLLLASAGDLYLYSLEERKLRRLTETPAPEEDPKISPDGTRITFVRDDNLHLLEVATGSERALTRDGEANRILNGKTDWVYWEEIWGRDSTGHWWSPDGQAIAYYRFDETPVASYPLVDFLPKYPTVEWQKYPKAGEDNPIVRVGVLHLQSGETVWIETGDPQEYYLARVHWRPDGSALAIQRLNREQTRLELLLCHPQEGGCSVLLTEEWPTWVNLGNEFTFLRDGRFIWPSERSGWRQLYLYDSQGKLIRQITPDGWAVASLGGLNDEGEYILYTAFRADDFGAKDRLTLRIKLDGSEPEGLTTFSGWYGANVAPGARFWAETWSDANTPPRILVRNLRTILATQLPSHPPEGYDPETLPQWEFLAIPGPGGSPLPARVLKPAGFDPGRKYPVIMYHYGGPGSQVVVNRWDGRGRDLWHKMMAQRGYLIFSVDNQGSIFFGKRGEDRLHRRFGEVNLAAQLAAVEYLKGLPYVDPNRIGLWGWSGGGTNTLYCLLNRPGVWQAAVAGAPVTDWHLYDTIWTERYLDRPQDNAKGYRDSSPVTYAGNLRDRLLVIHGTADDNVHPQNTLVLAERFIDEGKLFEEAIYPGQKHGFTGQHLRHFFQRMTEFFERHLGE